MRATIAPMGGWASAHIERLQAGQTVEFRPRGDSMSPRIRSGQRVVVEPVGQTTIRRGMIVLVEMNARTHYLHCVSAVAGSRVQISNAAGRVNGWVDVARVHGLLVFVGEQTPTNDGD